MESTDKRDSNGAAGAARVPETRGCPGTAVAVGNLCAGCLVHLVTEVLRAAMSRRAATGPPAAFLHELLDCALIMACRSGAASSKLAFLDWVTDWLIAARIGDRPRS